jgi:CRP/FNR family cyclic AMP-dependent transcriptional regulator
MAAAGAVRRLTLTETVTVADLPEAAEQLDLWYPVIPDGPRQLVLDMTVDPSLPLVPGYDADWGNPIRHLRLHGEIPRALSFRVRYLLYRVNHQPAVEGPSAAGPGQMLTRSLELDPAEADQLARVAAGIAGHETRSTDRALRLLEHTRCQPGGDLERARLMVRLCRAAGIPARLVSGHRPDERSGGQEREMLPHHWAELFVREAGWRQADPTCPPGQLELSVGLDHVARSRGEALLLQPVQRDRRLPTFARAYVEVNGRPHPVRTSLALVRDTRDIQERRPPGERRPTTTAQRLHQELAAAGRLKELRVPTGGVITGEPAGERWLYLLSAGRLRLNRVTPAGRKLELTTLQAPAMFLGPRLRAGFAEALDDCRLTTLSRSEVVELAARRPGFASLLLDTLTDRMLESDERMEYLAYHGSPARVAMALLRTCDTDGTIGGITHQDLADAIGNRRETVTKVLHDFKRAGWVRLGNRRIELLDPLALTRLLQE